MQVTLNTVDWMPEKALRQKINIRETMKKLPIGSADKKLDYYN